ncbi:Sec-independent protein translocase protein TatB [Siccirubricoccus deserti]
MFDLAWSEIALIGVVAIVIIGPKDLPEAIRGVARGIAKLRRMASEFQGQADELVREANLDEVRNSINEIRNFNIRGEIEKHVDKDGSIRKTFTEDPLKDSYTPPVYTPPPATEPPPAELEGAGAPQGSATPAAPAFIPPAYAPLPVSAAAPPRQLTRLRRRPSRLRRPAPAFVPPAEPVPAAMADRTAPHTQKI